MKKLVLTARFIAAALLMFVGCSEPVDPVPPAAPVNVTATLVSPTSVLVTWLPNPASDGVVTYGSAAVSAGSVTVVLKASSITTLYQ